MTFTVDVHHHILPDFFWAATNETGKPVGGFSHPRGRKTRRCPFSMMPASTSQ